MPAENSFFFLIFRSVLFLMHPLYFIVFLSFKFLQLKVLTSLSHWVCPIEFDVKAEKLNILSSKAVKATQSV